MKYPDYIEAANKHSYACRIIKEKISSFDSSVQDPQQYDFLVCSLYYLSGYIIECSLKFKVFEAFGHESDEEVTQTTCSRLSLSLRRVQTHDFDKLQDFITSKLSDFTYKSSEELVNQLLDNWEPGLRYEVHSFSSDNVLKFYEHSKQFLRQV